MARRLPPKLQNALKPAPLLGGLGLKPQEEFLRCLDKAILKGDESHTPSRSFHPSSMQCERNMFYQLKGVVQDEDSRTPELVGICDSGTDRHLRLQTTLSSKYMKSLGWEYVDVEQFIKENNLTHLVIVEKKEVETKLYDKVRNVSFMTDGILFWNYDKKYYVLEIKTESSRKFYKREGVDPKHYDQGIIYPLEFGLDGTIFLYECRDDTSHKAYLFPVDDRMKRRKEEQMARVTEAVADNQLPPIPIADVQKYACTYCGFKSLCKRNLNGDGHIDPKYKEEAKNG